MTARGQPDQSRSARYVLKDYVNGRLLFCHAPPGYKQEEFHTYAPRVRRELVEDQLPMQQQRALRVSINSRIITVTLCHRFDQLKNNSFSFIPTTD